MRGRYGNNDVSKYSRTWRMIENKELVDKHLKKNIHNGDSWLWFENWLGDGNISDALDEIPLDLKINKVYNNETAFKVTELRQSQFARIVTPPNASMVIAWTPPVQEVYKLNGMNHDSAI
ncbi:hypothetical protein ACH5RR_040921 [Cinchona calisaya]|uniref:Uncharacterized protein n=1 Tax=Cinchona calisaya TaxID=153742 RepID=A0ABD2XVB1_9GENT